MLYAVMAALAGLRLEKAVFTQTYNHMVDNGLYPHAQSSYRKNNSTETALLKVKNDILTRDPTHTL